MNTPLDPWSVIREASLTPLGARAFLRRATFVLTDAEIACLVSFLSPDVFLTAEGPSAVIREPRLLPGASAEICLSAEDIEPAASQPLPRPPQPEAPAYTHFHFQAHS